MARARERIAACPSRVSHTAAGTIEHLTFGEGPPLLLVHGVVGGCDQGPTIAEAYVGEGFRVIAVSRFGYGESPVPDDPSPEAQADLYAALLAELGISKTAILGTSAGTSSCLQFAIRHPDRCAALVLFSTAAPPYRVPPGPLLGALRALLRSEFLFWSIFQVRWARLRLVGVPSAVASSAAPDDRAFLARLVEELLPGSRRADGIVTDIAVSNPSLNRELPFERMVAPTLVIHARDDRWVPLSAAHAQASRIPGVMFRPVESGGHLLLGHRQVIAHEVAEFLRERAGS